MATTERLKGIGLEQFKNPTELSDIKITYGAHGERVFYGHKVILCKEARWFKAAFTGAFKESTSAELVLHDDDPDALEVLLLFPYWDSDLSEAKPWGSTLYNSGLEIPSSDHLFIDSILDTHGLLPKDWWENHADYGHASLECILLCVHIGEVADKYDCPRLLDTAAEAFCEFFCNWLEHLSRLARFADESDENNEDDDACEFVAFLKKYTPEVRLVVRSVYYWTSSRNNAMFRGLLNRCERMMCSLEPLLCCVAKSVPELEHNLEL